MLLTASNLEGLFKGFKTSFRKGFVGVEPRYKDIATIVPSSTAENVYTWLGQFPKMREWIGPRIVNNLMLHGYTVKNKDFENTVSVPRNAIEDDMYGVFAPLMEEMGRSAAELPDDLTFTLLGQGFVELCYDGRPFFDSAHPVQMNGVARVVSNVQNGDGPPWFLLDTSRPIKPLVFQERRNAEFVTKTQPWTDNVFDNKEFIYGVDGRWNAGFALWQLAFASTAPLTHENYAAARAAMASQVGETGRPLGVQANTLVVPTVLEADALAIVAADTRVAVIGEGDRQMPVAVANVWRGTASHILSPYLPITNPAPGPAA